MWPLVGVLVFAALVIGGCYWLLWWAENRVDAALGGAQEDLHE